MKVRSGVTTQVPVEWIRWGPTWAEMKVAAQWIGESGVPFRFNEISGLPPDLDEGLPPLFLFDRSWNKHEVRIGWYLVKFGQGDVRPYPPAAFKREFKEISL